MPFIKVATLKQLEKEPLIEVMVQEEPVALCKVDGEVFALYGTCPHQGGPLGQGMITGHGIMCPWHAWTFDCRTGINDVDPSEKVQIFPVRIEDGNILVDLPIDN